MKKPNMSAAVQAQRKSPTDTLDDFPTQPWAGRALCEYILDADLSKYSVWEPACNRGYLALALAEYFGTVHTSDIFDYPDKFFFMDRREDFLFPGSEPAAPVDWIITNPPFKLGEQFVLRALDIAQVGVAMLLRTQFLEGKGRYERLFNVQRPRITAVFSERLSLVHGKVDPESSQPTSYMWFVWMKHNFGRTFQEWIPPCRARLERPNDYPDASGPAT